MPPTAYVSNDINGYIAFGAQSAVATLATTFTFAKYLDGGGITHTRKTTEEREGGSGQDLTLAYVEDHVADSSIPIYARPEMTLRLLAYAMGYATRSSAASTLPYTHEVTPVDQARLLTYEEFGPSNSLGQMGIDSKITALKIEGQHGKPIKITADLSLGQSPQNRDTGSARTVVLEGEDPFFFNTASHQIAVGGAYAGADEVTKWTVTWQRNVDDQVFGVGMGRQAIPELNREITVEITRRYMSATGHIQVAYGLGSQAAASVATGAFKVFMQNNPGPASALRSFELEVPLMDLDIMKRNVFEPDGNTVYEDIMGKALKGATFIMRAQIKNALPTSVASGLL